MAVPARIQMEEIDGVKVVRFRESRIYDDRTVREVADQILDAFPASGPMRLVLDFSGVDLISSLLLGKLILIQRRVEASGGTLRLCEMAPVVRAVFRTSNLDRLFAIDRDRRESLEAS